MKTTLALLLVFRAVTLDAQPAPAGKSALALAVTFDAARSATPLDGRLLLLLSTDPAQEPRAGEHLQQAAEGTHQSGGVRTNRAAAHGRNSADPSTGRHPVREAHPHSQ